MHEDGSTGTTRSQASPDGRRATALALAVAAGLATAAAVFVFQGRLQFQGTDFAPVYAAARAALLGVDIYDASGLAPIVESVCPGGTVYLGYPPWTVLSTVWLGLLPVDAAGRLWLLASLAMVLGAVHLLTPAWPTWQRAAAFLAGGIFVPTLGLLRVGQFTAPVVLGAALLASPRAGRAPLATAAGLVLLAQKPHIGLPIVLCILPALWTHRHRAVAWACAIGAALACASFLIAPSWPAAYPRSALELLRDHRNVACDTCSSLVAAFAHVLPPGGRVALAIAILIGAAWLARKREAEIQVAAAVAAVALALPYFRNYDTVVLLVPLLVAWPRLGGGGRAVLAVAWALPTIALGTAERATGASASWMSGVLVLVALLWPRRVGMSATQQQPKCERP